MMRGFATPRRADEFDRLLSDGSVDDASQYAEMLELVASIRDLPEVNARPEFVATLRERLVAEAAAMPAPTTVDRATAARLTPAHPTVRRERRLATVLGGFAVASATASMAVASQGAMPGDVLYPVKRAIENAQTELQTDDTQQASTLLSHAERRLGEAQQLSDDGSDSEAITAALGDLSDQTAAAADLAIADYEATGNTTGIEDVHAFSERAAADLTALSPTVPTDARAALISAVQSLRTIAATSLAACPTCAGPSAATDLVADLGELLDAEPEGLRSYAALVEDVAAQTPQQGETETETDPASPPEQPDPTPTGTDEPTADPSADPTEGTVTPDPGAVVPQVVETVVDPITTLVGEVTNGLQDLHQAAQESWEQGAEDLMATLGGSGSSADSETSQTE